MLLNMEKKIIEELTSGGRKLPENPKQLENLIKVTILKFVYSEYLKNRSEEYYLKYYELCLRLEREPFARR